MSLCSKTSEVKIVAILLVTLNPWESFVFAFKIEQSFGHNAERYMHKKRVAFSAHVVLHALYRLHCIRHRLLPHYL